MQKIISGLIFEILFPTRCTLCKKPGFFLCPDCISLLDISPAHFPDRRQKYLDDVWAACDYENRFTKKIITQLKYEPFQKTLAAPLAGIIADHFKLAEEKPKTDAMIIAIPLAKKRLRWRGFNQAQAIAAKLSRLWQLPTDNSILIRMRETKNQAELSKSQRQENIKGAFACSDPAAIKKKIVYLIDDVFTTGATMNECAKVLKHCGAAEVIGIAFARTNE